ncbi:MAG: L,D-transpeptidase family protein, partial [Acidobacteriota bacterium]
RAEAAIHRYLIMERESPDIVVPSEIRSPHPSASTVTKLTQRLAQLGDIPSLSGQPDLSDPEMISIIKRFQSRHDLPTSGIIDARTLQQLNVPIARRLEQLNLTLERWRWVPRSFSEAPVVVNIPEFRLRAYDEHLNVALSMPVIVGRVAHRKTPVLQATMTQVIFHPYWNVPRDIQQREIVPHILRSPGYLAARDYELVNRNGGVEHLSTSATVAGLSNGTLRVRQVPGAKNALGSIKFVFPNGYNVYMHGTPEMNLFQQTRRDFSHGCIRVQDPGSLAAWVLRRQDGWSREHIDASVANPASTTIFLSHPIPVLVVYGTGIAAEDESIKFLDDVYGYDATLEKSLDQLSETRRLAQR